MPIYVYECTNCEDVTEVIQKFSDQPLEKCEHCGGRLEKQLSVPSLHFKGRGWASDGYSSSNEDKSKVVKETRKALAGKSD